MFFLRLVLQIFRLAFTLWLTISFVYLLSQFLPVVNTPKGMLEAEYAVYGSADSRTLSKVKEDFLTRRGLNLPLFYFKLDRYGEIAADQIPSSEEEKLWITSAVMKHGVQGTRSFYLIWQKWSQNASSQEKSNLFKDLVFWAEQENHFSAIPVEKAITKFLSTSSSKEAPQLLESWKLLLKQSSPFHYYLTVLRWNGSNNRYHQWLTNICQGNLGASTQDQTPVTEKIKTAFQVSSSLAVLGLFFASILSFLAGLHFAQKAGSVFTKVGRKFLYFLDSIPGFLIALVIFGIYLAFGGTLSSPIPEDTPETPFLHLLNPAVLLGSVCISLFVIPHLSLQFTQGLLEQKNKSYYRTALGKGISPKRAMWKHALPNTLVPTLTLLSEVIISLVAGVLVVEITFSLPGIGSLFTNSILNGDYPVMIGLTLLLLVFRLAVVWISDLTFVLVDPRMKIRYF